MGHQADDEHKYDDDYVKVMLVMPQANDDAFP